MDRRRAVHCRSRTIDAAPAAIASHSSIVMPPPNVTAVLHMGHGLNNTVQDVLVRWRRMCGDEALWVPGTDHAGIATQNVVEKQLAAEGKTRFDLGREAFVAAHDGLRHRNRRHDPRAAARDRRVVRLDAHRVHAVARAVARRARSVRAAVRARAHLSRPPRHSLVPALPHVAERRGSGAQRRDGQALSHRVSARRTIRRGSITIATTRPETMLADVAVAVHPDDERYRDLIGKTVMLPIANVEIPIIADAIRAIRRSAPAR